ncbi:type IV pilus modification protein PilV [Ferrimonas lipolytica]|uniref:Type IV pilus modification protein PilV n=1 Tax=Ferrimonas lipolytica TaxID=2724191 RepID=A0A6H1UDG8_9GAMM|nr:type IV pilus modification protein PilV [Ferrimonas lipolytica]QIZ77121.1 type IV pilus modification protein PilV [Ferrimonas lipolytica]
MSQQLAIAAKQQGFTLIELLIAVLVVSIALLGFARLQVSSLQNAREARFSQTAYSAMLDLSERIRSEPRAAIDGEFNFTNLTTGTAPVAVDCLSTTVSCSRAQFALYELQEWFNYNSTSVPQLRFAVTQTPLQPNIFDISITWDAALTGVGVDTCNSDGQSHQCVGMQLWIR